MGMNMRFNITIPMDESDHGAPNLTKDEWRHYMKEKIYHVEPPVCIKSWMILKPPQALLEVKPEAYYPKLVTIGPLYQNLEPSPINNYKALCVNKFMERHRIPVVEYLMQHLISAQPHDELSRIYDLNLPESDFEWLQLLVTVDTIFIHEFLMFWWIHKPMQSVCSYFATLYFNDHTLRMRLPTDLLLIGNQIPMSFLKKIADYPDFTVVNLENTARDFILKHNPFFHSEDVRSRFLGYLRSRNIKLVYSCEHLLDSLYYSCTAEAEKEIMRQPHCKESTRILVYSCFSYLGKLLGCKKSEEQGDHKKEYVRLPTASELCKAGIRFKACEGNISVMKYDKTNTEIHLPRLVVDDSTGDVLRNLIAHEITSRKEDKFSMYAVIMDMLIDTPQDLRILRKDKVIENHMGNDERFVDMWNNMCINVAYNDKSETWEKMIHDIVAHHSSLRRRWYAEFYKKFFSRPWLTASFIAAFLLLSGTIYQAAYSGINYYKPKH